MRSQKSDAAEDASGRGSLQRQSFESEMLRMDCRRQLSGIPGSPAYSDAYSASVTSADQSSERRTPEISTPDSSTRTHTCPTSSGVSRSQQNVANVEDGVDGSARAALPKAESAVLPEHPGGQVRSTEIQGGNDTKPERVGTAVASQRQVNADAIVAQPPKASLLRSGSMSPRVNSPRLRGRGTPANIPVTSHVKTRSFSTSPDARGTSQVTSVGSGLRSRFESEDGSGHSLRSRFDSLGNEGNQPVNNLNVDVEIGVRNVRLPEGKEEGTGAIIGRKDFPGGSC